MSSRCSKCGCEIPSGQKKCDSCKRKVVDIIKKVGETVAAVAGCAIVLVGGVILKDKNNNS